MQDKSEDASVLDTELTRLAVEVRQMVQVRQGGV